MRDSSVAAPFDVRLAHARKRLAGALSFEEAFIAIHEADAEVLRALEADYTVLPGPFDTIRERIAKTHDRLIRAKIKMSTKLVTPAFVAEWAYQALELFLSGVTEFDECLGQYRIRPAPSPTGSGDTFEVSTMQGHDPRRFQVTVTVKEIRP